LHKSENFEIKGTILFYFEKLYTKKNPEINYYLVNIIRRYDNNSDILGEVEPELTSPLPGDKTALVAPEAGWSQLSGMLIGCSAAATLLLALVRLLTARASYPACSLVAQQLLLSS
jgi:hypothetical protein